MVFQQNHDHILSRHETDGHHSFAAESIHCWFNNTVHEGCGYSSIHCVATSSNHFAACLTN